MDDPSWASYGETVLCVRTTDATVNEARLAIFHQVLRDAGECWVHGALTFAAPRRLPEGGG